MEKIKWRSPEEVLDYAIAEEQKAADFYFSLAEKSRDIAMRVVFTQFAGEEIGHRKKLEAVRAGKAFLTTESVKNLRVSDYLADIDPGSVESYQDALLLAAKREKAAFRLYTSLSEIVSERSHKEIFLVMAQEEARHKLRFEIEYDDLLREN